MQEAIRRFVPHRIVTNKSKSPLWMAGKVLRNVKKKHKLWKKWKERSHEGRGILRNADCGMWKVVKG